VVKGLIARKGDHSKYYGEEAGEAWEGTDPVCHIGAETGWVRRVEEGA
jgi:hypothetical protein